MFNAESMEKPVQCMDCEHWGLARSGSKCLLVKFYSSGFCSECPFIKDRPVINHSVPMNPQLYDFYVKVNDSVWFMVSVIEHKREWALKYMASVENVGTCGIVKDVHFSFGFNGIKRKIWEKLRESKKYKDVSDYLHWTDVWAQPIDVSDTVIEKEEILVIPDVDPFENWELPEAGEQMELF